MVSNGVKQAKWFIENKDKLHKISCLPFEHVDGKYNAGCKFCIVYEFSDHKGICLGERKILAANTILRRNKLERINKI